MKMKRKLKKWVKILIFILLIILIIILLFFIKKINVKEPIKEKNINIKYKKHIYTNENYQLQNEIDNYLEQKRIEEIKRKEEEIKRLNSMKTYETRLTSYYLGDNTETTTKTGSGLDIYDFEVNNNGWYTYQGKLVVATATNYLIKYGFVLGENIKTYKYYDELVLNIDGIDYQAIVLDSCGSSMKTGRIDLFVSNKESVKDTKIIVKEK
jgi:hypothetical protein